MRCRPSPYRYNIDPKKRGRKPDMRPLTDDQRRLAEAHYPEAARLAAKRILPRYGRSRDEDIADLATTAILAAVRKFDPAITPEFVPWLGRFVRVRSADFRSRWRRDLSLWFDIPDRARFEARIEDAEESASILRRLPPPNAEALRLTTIDGLSQAEAAGRLGCSQVEVSRLISRSRQLLGAQGC